MTVLEILEPDFYPVHNIATCVNLFCNLSCNAFVKLPRVLVTATLLIGQKAFVGLGVVWQLLAVLFVHSQRTGFLSAASYRMRCAKGSVFVISSYFQLEIESVREEHDPPERKDPCTPRRRTRVM